MISIPRLPLSSALTTVLLALVLASSGCHYQADLDIASNGSGHGRVVIFDPPLGVTKEDLAHQLGINGFQVLSVSAPNGETLQADVSWQDFDKPFRQRIQNADHSITLDFGAIDQGQLQVHVPGRLDAGDTTGTLTDAQSVTFRAGRARLTYAPSPHGIVIVVASLALTLVMGVVLTLLLSRKRSP